MKRRLLLAPVALVMVLLISSGGCYRYHSATCKQRGAAYTARVETLKREAHEKLKIGTKKDDVARFFAENGIPLTFSLTFSGREASGTIYTFGCAPAGCGSDAALLGLQVKVDEAGTVVSEPDVGSLYTNCL